MVCSVSYSFILIADLDTGSSLSPNPIPGSPEVNQPFSIPCFDDVEKQLFPRDAAEFTDIVFSWELSVVGNPSAAYPADVAEDPTRIKVDPVTGGFKKFDLEVFSKLNSFFCQINFYLAHIILVLLMSMKQEKTDTKLATN